MKRIKNKPIDSTERLKQQSEKEIANALKELQHFTASLQYPTFFIPGWTDESNTVWQFHFKGGYYPIKHWISKADPCYFVTYSKEETENSHSILELGKLLKQKIMDKIRDAPINIVAHSMGGLESRVAIIDQQEPQINVKYLITVGTPNNGERFARALLKVKKYKMHHQQQCLSMLPKGTSMRHINSRASRELLLDRIDKIYVFMGLRDHIAGTSAKFKKDDIPRATYEKKVKTRQYYAATHSLPQDPRAARDILYILSGVPLVSNYNYGYVFRKGQVI